MTNTKIPGRVKSGIFIIFEQEIISDMRFFYSYEMPIGKIFIAEEYNHIVEVSFLNLLPLGVEKETELIQQAARQLKEYFAKQRKVFDLPVKLQGSEFQLKVWAELQNIAYGKLCSYKDIAEAIGKPKAMRAVGGANNKNRLPIIVPCHRVVGSNGNLVGYAAGLDIKEFLINLEK